MKDNKDEIGCLIGIIISSIVGIGLGIVIGLNI